MEHPERSHCTPCNRDKNGVVLIKTCNSFCKESTVGNQAAIQEMEKFEMVGLNERQNFGGAGQCIEIVGRFVPRPAFLLVLGAILGILGFRTFQSGRSVSGETRPRFATGSAPGVYFMSDERSLFDAIESDALVQVCAHAVDIELGEQVIMIDRATYTARHLRDALKLVGTLKTTCAVPERSKSGEQQSAISPPPIGSPAAIGGPRSKSSPD